MNDEYDEWLGFGGLRVTLIWDGCNMDQSGKREREKKKKG